MSEHPPLPGDRVKVEEKPSVSARRALAFEGVFGQETGPRSSDQRIVLAYLREMCGRDKPVFTQDKNGRFDPLRSAHVDGAQTQYLIIKQQLRIAAKSPEKKSKVRSKR